MAAFYSGQYFRNFVATSVIKEPIVKNNNILVENYTKNILCKYSDALTNLNDKPIAEWQENQFFKKLNKVNNVVLNSTSAVQINIYNKNLDKIFSTNNNKLIFDENNNEASKDLSKNTSIIIPLVNFYDKNKNHNTSSLIKTIITTNTKKCGDSKKNLDLMIEIYNDISSTWNNLHFFETVISASILAILIILYIALFIASRKTEKLVNRQHDEKIK